MREAGGGEVKSCGISLSSLCSAKTVDLCMISLAPFPYTHSYFKHGQLFGLSCFEKIPVASQVERGVRMKSVGLLAVGYSDLHLHMDFLQRQVR